MQNEVLYNSENVRSHFVVRLFLVFILKFLIKYGDINSIFHSDKISANNFEEVLWVKRFCHFP